MARRFVAVVVSSDGSRLVPRPHTAGSSVAAGYESNTTEVRNPFLN